MSKVDEELRLRQFTIFRRMWGDNKHWGLFIPILGCHADWLNFERQRNRSIAIVSFVFSIISFVLSIFSSVFLFFHLFFLLLFFFWSLRFLWTPPFSSMLLHSSLLHSILLLLLCSTLPASTLLEAAPHSFILIALLVIVASRSTMLLLALPSCRIVLGIGDSCTMPPRSFPHYVIIWAFLLLLKSCIRVKTYSWGRGCQRLSMDGMHFAKGKCRLVQTLWDFFEEVLSPVWQLWCTLSCRMFVLQSRNNCWERRHCGNTWINL